jgi:hypothetical protein
MAMSNIAGNGESCNSNARVQDQQTHIKTYAKRCVLARKDTKDDLLEIIVTKELEWYHSYVVNYFMFDAASPMGKKFGYRFCLPYPSYHEVAKQIKCDK